MKCRKCVGTGGQERMSTPWVNAWGQEGVAMHSSAEEEGPVWKWMEGRSIEAPMLSYRISKEGRKRETEATSRNSMVAEVQKQRKKQKEISHNAMSVGQSSAICLWVSQGCPFSMFSGTPWPRNIFPFFPGQERTFLSFLPPPHPYLSCYPSSLSWDFSDISLYLESTHINILLWPFQYF